MYYVYLVMCADATLYTGITTDLARRVAEHNTGLGAKYTRGRLPVTLVYAAPCSGRAQASREEMRIKRLPRTEKLMLVRSSHECRTQHAS
jgi:putative endonuclease